MSYWTYVNGTVTVSPIGRTQAEKEYILKTILEHLPLVTGSEGGMRVDVIEKKTGCSSSCSHDEFGEMTDNLTDRYGCKNRHKGWLNMNENYILVVYGSLRDREFDQTYREFIKWLTRLAKRVDVQDVLVEITGYDRSEIIRNNQLTRPKSTWETMFGQMYESPSWSKGSDGEPAWWEYLYWQPVGGGCQYPGLLAYKYVNDEENDRKVEEWIR